MANKEEKFWEWFSKNQERFYNLTPTSDDIADVVNEIGNELRKVNEDLQFELKLDPEPNQKKIFYISAGGIEEVFPEVETLYNCAPELDKWEVVKFRQRKGSAGEILIGDWVFTEENIYYKMDTGPMGEVELNIYFEDFDDEAFDLFAQVGFIFLDAILGEYDVTTKVGQIEFLPLEIRDKPRLKQIKDLAEDFDSRVNN